MKKRIAFLSLVFLVGIAKGQVLSSQKILAKTIAYHDPQKQWSVFQHKLDFKADLPDGSSRETFVIIDNTKGLFEYHNAGKGLAYGVVLDSCYTISGETPSCDRIKRSRNYYVYLWGLPMKLQDEGTTVEDWVGQETLKETQYYVIKVVYPKDVWYYYIHPETFAMEAYKFYKDEPNQKGEIIYLEKEMTVQNIKIPVSRSWYRTENDEYLATDNLVGIKKID